MWSLPPFELSPRIEEIPPSSTGPRGVAPYGSTLHGRPPTPRSRCPSSSSFMGAGGSEAIIGVRRTIPLRPEATSRRISSIA